MTQSSGITGICQGCGRRLYVRLDGVVKQHKDIKSYVRWYCTGSEQQPVTGSLICDIKLRSVSY